MKGSLCITRNVDEWVRVGPDVWVQVVLAQGGKARLRFVAPPEVRIMRSELVDEEPPASRIAFEPSTHGWDEHALAEGGVQHAPA